MNSKKKTPFIIRVAQKSDVDACLKLDHSIETQTVWQMKLTEETDKMQVTFQTLRLPRSIRVEYPRAGSELQVELSAAEGFLVAEAEGILLGYIHLRVTESDGNAWVRNLVVDDPWRRRRIGRALFEQGRHWAQRQKATHITLETTTRSYPSMRFMMGLGMQFCGFNDQYYSGKDIALFFGQGL